MSQSLRDQLLGLGFKPAKASERSPRPGAAGRKEGRRGRAGKEERKGRPEAAAEQEIDLARAWALRAEQEKAERLAREKERQEAARRRREARARLSAFLAGKALNDPQAEIARHFEYGGKIKRVHVTPEQLRALNAGELGVVQDQGRYLLVTAADLAEAEAICPEAIALKVDPHTPEPEDPYADPRYRVPDDLIW
ncbi:MAG: hypothetical protein KatS3mg126_2465 [Lysobacteraceae bacterium]|nr:MAG: hypothetical protein KatS3mg126_2465 [Xanthomonadaceae bacterium]